MPALSSPDPTTSPQQVSYSRTPDQCPLCHHGIEPTGPLAHAVAIAKVWHVTARLEMVFRCPRHDCGRLFVARYRRVQQESSGNMKGDFVLAEAVPVTSLPPSTGMDRKGVASPTATAPLVCWLRRAA